MKESHKLIDLKHLNTYTYLKGAFVECCFRHCWHVYGSQLLIHIFFHLGVAATPLITLLLRQERDLHLIMSTILGWIRLYF